MIRPSLRALFVTAMVVVSALGCDQLNKPIRPLKNNPPRPQPTTEVTAADAGEAGAPAPAITAEPGDVHL